MATKTKQNFRVVGYLRCSTADQELDNQRLGVLEYANKHHYKVEFIKEHVSGKVPYQERALGKILEELKEGDLIIVSELSRLGRSMLEVMSFLCELSKNGIRLFAVKGNHSVDSSLQSKVMTMVFCMASEIERELISARTIEALARKKALGYKLGRPKGPGKSKLDPKLEEIRHLYLDKKINKANLARLFDVAYPTMDNFIKKKVVKQA